MKQRRIKKGDVVRVVNNLGSSVLDQYIGEIAEVGVIAKNDDGKCVYHLMQLPDIEFFSTELQLLDNEIRALIRECLPPIEFVELTRKQNRKQKNNNR